jgi:hypothetical protein
MCRNMKCLKQVYNKYKTNGSWLMESVIFTQIGRSYCQSKTNAGVWRLPGAHTFTYRPVTDFPLIAPRAFSASF